MSGDPFSRSCLVCTTPCSTEGQLCRACAVKGHRVTDAEVILAINVAGCDD